jgi:acetolactate synthase-1/3 small subunit
VWAVLDYTETRTISRELLLVKVSILGPEYLDDQLTGGPSHEPRASHRAHAEQTKLAREMALARQFEESKRPPSPPPPLSSPPPPPLDADAAASGAEGAKPLTPGEALRVRHQHLQSLHVLANQFGARIVDVSDHSIILEMSAKTSRVEAFLSLVKPFGIIESARTGTLRVRFEPRRAGNPNFRRADVLCFFFSRFDGHAAHTHRWTDGGRRNC